jgi:uncharacterized protein (TIGR03067 family)
MRRLALLFTVLSLSCLAFAPAPVPRPKRAARQAGPSMEGLWRRQLGGGTVRITAATWTNNPERGGAPDFDVKADPRTSPATFDMSLHRATELYLRGIYKVEGDVLTIHYRHARRGRPAAFDDLTEGAATEVFTRAR